jgi:lipoxygenase homology domain-containing protein 1
MTTYRIDVYTPPQPGACAGTDANVFLTLYGARASSAELKMASNGHRFGTSGVDSLSVHLPCLGDVSRIHVRHDNTGVAPGWFLDRIVVRNEESGREWTFPCQRWLDRHLDDGEIERLLEVS